MFGKIKTERVLISVVSISILATLLIGLFLKQDKSEAYYIEKTINYGFTIRNLTNQLVNNGNVYIYAPVKETTLQKTLSIEANLPYELVEGAAGNQLLRFRVDSLPPFGSRVISIRSRVAFADATASSWMNFFSNDDLSGYLGVTPYVETEHPRLIKQAAKLKVTSNMDTARATYSWVARHLIDNGYIERDRGALHALLSGAGDCTEFMYLYTALARINGIPTRGVAGFVVKENSILDPSKYHNWSQSHLDGEWRNVDPSRKVFLSDESQYLSFRILGVDDQVEGISQSLASIDPDLIGRIAIKMNQPGQEI